MQILQRRLLCAVLAGSGVSYGHMASVLRRLRRVLRNYGTYGVPICTLWLLQATPQVFLLQPIAGGGAELRGSTAARERVTREPEHIETGHSRGWLRCGNTLESTRYGGCPRS